MQTVIAILLFMIVLGLLPIIIPVATLWLYLVLAFTPEWVWIFLAVVTVVVWRVSLDSGEDCQVG